MIRNNKFFIVVLGLIAVLFAILYAVTPYYIDDLMYLRGAFGVEDKIETMKIAWMNCLSRLSFDTGRLANLISPPFLSIVPKWLHALITGAIVSWMIYEMVRIGRVPLNSGRSWFCVAVVVLLLPWSDFILSVDYSLNYVWTSVLTLASLRFIFRRSRGEASSSKPKMAMEMFVCVLAGWFHEGFSVPIFVGLCVYFVICSEWKQNKSVLMLLAAYALGIVLLMTPSATWVRMSRCLESPGIYVISLKTIIRFFIVPIIFFIVWAFKLCSSEFRRNRMTAHGHDLAYLVFIAISVLTSSLLVVKFYYGTRMAWCPTMLATLGLMHIQTLSPIIRVKRICVSVGMSVLVLVMVLTNLTYSIVKQVEYTKIHNEFMAQYIASPDGRVRFDVPLYQFDLSLGKTTIVEFYYDWPKYVYKWYYNKPYFEILPLEEPQREP